MFPFLSDGMAVQADGRQQASSWHALHHTAVSTVLELSLVYYSLYSLPKLPV